MDEFIQYLDSLNIVGWLMDMGGRLLLALLIFYVGRFIARKVQKALEALLRKREVDDVLVDFLGTIASVLIVVVAIVAALDALGIPATSLVAVMGAAGLAVGLALKDSLSNFAAGVMLVLFRPFTKGDYVEAGGVAGTVDEVWLVSTRLISPDNKEIIVPNSMIWGDQIVNYSARDTRRVDMVFGVGYDDDLKTATEVLRKVCEENSMVLADPAVKVFVSNLGDSTVDINVRPWVNTPDYWAAHAEITESAKVALEAAGLNIPYPQVDIHIQKDVTVQSGD